MTRRKRIIVVRVVVDDVMLLDPEDSSGLTVEAYGALVDAVVDAGFTSIESVERDY